MHVTGMGEVLLGHTLRAVWWRYGRRIGCLGSILLLVAAAMGLQGWWSEHLPHPWPGILQVAWVVLFFFLAGTAFRDQPVQRTARTSGSKATGPLLRAWPLVAVLVVAVGVGAVVGIRSSAGGGRDHRSTPTSSTTPGSGAVAQFARLHADRAHALDAWAQAVSAPVATFLPVSAKVLSEEQRIRDQARAAADTCETADKDPCQLLDTLRDLADQEGHRLGNLERAKRLGRRAEAYTAFTGLQAVNCDYASKVIDLLHQSSSPIPLSRRLPALRDQAYAIALAACDPAGFTYRELLQAARAAHVRPAKWPPSVLRMDPPEREWRIYAAAVDRSAPIVEDLLAELQRDLEAVRNGAMPPDVFPDLVGPDPIAAQSEVDLDAPKPITDTTLIGRLGKAVRIIAKLGPPADPSVRRAWQRYLDALDSYGVAMGHAAAGDLEGMRAAFAKGNSRATSALALFAAHRR
jgi:hypothetical protein